MLYVVVVCIMLLYYVVMLYYVFVMYYVARFVHKYEFVRHYRRYETLKLFSADVTKRWTADSRQSTVDGCRPFRLILLYSYILQI